MLFVIYANVFKTSVYFSKVLRQPQIQKSWWTGIVHCWLEKKEFISSFFFFKKIFTSLLSIQYSFCVYAYWPEETQDLITDGCNEAPWFCQEMNSWPLEEQVILLTSEPSIQLLISSSFVSLPTYPSYIYHKLSCESVCLCFYVCVYKGR